MDFRLNILLTFILAAMLTFFYPSGIDRAGGATIVTAAPLASISSSSSGSNAVNCAQAGVAGCFQYNGLDAAASQQPQRLVDFSQQMALIP